MGLNVNNLAVSLVRVALYVWHVISSSAFLTALLAQIAPDVESLALSCHTVALYTLASGSSHSVALPYVSSHTILQQRPQIVKRYARSVMLQR